MVETACVIAALCGLRPVRSTALVWRWQSAAIRVTFPDTGKAVLEGRTLMNHTIVELFVPLGVFTMSTIVVALVCRLIAPASLNKTIREALRSDPGSVPALADKLEARQPWADALLGWLLLAFAATIVAIGLFEDPSDRREIFETAVIPAVLGVVTLVYTQ